MEDRKLSQVKNNILNYIAILEREQSKKEELRKILEDIAHGKEVSVEVKTATVSVYLERNSLKNAPGIIASFVGEIIEAVDERGLDHIAEIVKDCNALLGIESK